VAVPELCGFGVAVFDHAAGVVVFILGDPTEFGEDSVVSSW